MNIRRSNTEKRGIVDLSAKPTPEQLQNDIKLMRMQIEKEKTAKRIEKNSKLEEENKKLNGIINNWSEI